MIIGISGKVGVGKTVLTNHLLQMIPNYERLGFADILKEEAADKFGFPKELCYSQEGKCTEIPVKVGNNDGYVFPFSDMPFQPWHEETRTVREILQWWGTDVCRAADPDHWVKAFEVAMKDLAICDVIIDDIRFHNEAEFVLRQNGILIRLNPYEGWKPGPTAKHPSETALDYYDKWNLSMAPAYGELECAALQVVCEANWKAVELCREKMRSRT